MRHLVRLSSSEEDEDDDKELDGLAQNIVLSSAAAATRKLNYKLLMFHENRRPAYWGTWSKQCRDVTGRRPLGKAQVGWDVEVGRGIWSV